MNMSESSTGKVLVFRPSEGCEDASGVPPRLQAQDLLSALTSGKGIDLADLALTGELDFGKLPLVPAQTLETVATGPSKAKKEIPGGFIHVVSGPVSLRHVAVVDLWDAHPEQADVVFQGPVTITDTIFRQLVDFSQVRFFGPVDFSHTTFQHEAYFVRTTFHQEARFENGRFGPRTRFHQARFRGPVSFYRTHFQGMAEFLEVTFERDAKFVGVTFNVGTGFSGSRFQEAVDFSEAGFHREAFFTYTVFEKDALFRQATFASSADFAHARFQGADELSRASFAQEPRLEGVVRARPLGKKGFLEGPLSSYAFAAALLGCLAILVYIVRRLRTKGSIAPLL